MWTQVSIENFRALRSVDVTLRPLTVLVGPNDSGKSSFLEALLFLGQDPRPSPLSQAHHWRRDENSKIALAGVFADHRFGLGRGAGGKSTRTHNDQPFRILIKDQLGQFAVASFPAMRHQLLKLRPDAIGFAEPGAAESEKAPALADGPGLARFLDHLLRRDRKRFFALLDAARGLIPGLEDIEIRTPAPDQRQLDLRRQARDEERARGTALPAGLGAAVPHGESCLLDDSAAVRTALQLDDGVAVPSVKKVRSPKSAFETLHGQSARAAEPIRAIYADTAREVTAARCLNKKRTGFADFVDDVTRELGPLMS